MWTIYLEPCDFFCTVCCMSHILTSDFHCSHILLVLKWHQGDGYPCYPHSIPTDTVRVICAKTASVQVPSCRLVYLSPRTGHSVKRPLCYSVSIVDSSSNTHTLCFCLTGPFFRSYSKFGQTPKFCEVCSTFSHDNIRTAVNSLYVNCNCNAVVIKWYVMFWMCQGDRGRWSHRGRSFAGWNACLSRRCRLWQSPWWYIVRLA